MSYNPRLLGGWLGEEKAAQEFERLKANFRPFEIIGEKPSGKSMTEGVRVCMWEGAQKAIGKHVRTFRQEIGDCVSFGAATAVMYLTVMQMALGQNWEYHEVFQPFIYGTSRCDVGGQHDYSDGSTGSWAAQAVNQYGVLFYDDKDVPAYAGSVAKKWGYSGPPKEFYPVAKDNPVKTTAKVTSFDQLVKAIGNGYPCTIASSVGFEGDGNMQGKISGGKCWGVRGSSWMHQMAVIAVDTVDSRPGAFIMNSWGANVWPEQPDGAPPGGFWADAKYMEDILGQGDSYAFSNFDGFPAQEIDFAII